MAWKHLKSIYKELVNQIFGNYISQVDGQINLKECRHPSALLPELYKRVEKGIIQLTTKKHPSLLRTIKFSLKESKYAINKNQIYSSMKKTADILWHHLSFSHEMTSEEQAQ